MLVRIRWPLPAVLCSVVVGLLVVLPQGIHMLDDRFEGIPVPMSADEHSYFSNVQEALLGRFGQAGKGITRESTEEPSFHLSPVEEIYGLLFSGRGCARRGFSS